MRPPEPQIKTLASVICMSWCADLLSRVTQGALIDAMAMSTADGCAEACTASRTPPRPHCGYFGFSEQARSNPGAHRHLLEFFLFKIAVMGSATGLRAGFIKMTISPY